MARRIMVDGRLHLALAAAAAVLAEHEYADAKSCIEIKNEIEYPAEPRLFKSKPRKDWEKRQPGKRKHR